MNEDENGMMWYLELNDLWEWMTNNLDDNLMPWIRQSEYDDFTMNGVDFQSSISPWWIQQGFWIVQKNL